MVKENAKGSSIGIRWDLNLIYLVNLQSCSHLWKSRKPILSGCRVVSSCYSSVVTRYVASFSYVTVKGILSAWVWRNLVLSLTRVRLKLHWLTFRWMDCYALCSGLYDNTRKTFQSSCFENIPLSLIWAAATSKMSCFVFWARCRYVLQIF